MDQTPWNDQDANGLATSFLYGATVARLGGLRPEFAESPEAVYRERLRLIPETEDFIKVALALGAYLDTLYKRPGAAFEMGMAEWLGDLRQRLFACDDLGKVSPWLQGLTAATLTLRGQFYLMFLVHWARAGFPSINVETSYAAMLCGTRAPAEVTAQVLPPWDAFVINLPPGWFSTREPTAEEGSKSLFPHPGSVYPLYKLFVLHIPTEEDGQKTWFLMAAGPGGAPELFNFRVQGEQLATQIREDDPLHDATDVQLTELDRRTFFMLERLLQGICLTCAQGKDAGPAALAPIPVRRRPKGVSPFAWQKAQATRGLPYVLGAPVRIDASNEIKDFVSGRASREVCVRTIVRRHWRNQACGPRHSERKLLMIEPHERGPKGAPLNVKPHEIRGETVR